ncbi:MAG: fluoride efflux transporter CrcB [Acinetobacter sp.]|jgi:CrcB protein|uniref:Fluoride-specific ion channel FluC n=1 Tax=Acinetobacter albensis TaxID=1673609 RepID=A0A1C4GTI2_9GAMM|nr:MULTISPECIES: fluoride efflux transporter CrcB [Acinetobacter]ALD02655.1 chromosome condensation protein CrcB [Acinetobacter sp. TTH0-4]QPF38256.1 fluoride efflux transporter CrcB [Acinetobacter sp. TTH0-4]SCC71474.1 CrcB protein [Acinetobacter albensis]
MSWLWVALGGAIGASLRYGTGVFLIKPNSLFPWATWSINILGCLLAGIFFAYSQKFPILQNEARLFLMVGILGGFTTFSSFGLETFQLLKHGQASLAFGYALSSVVVGILFLAAGFYLFEWILNSK